ncbi:glycosyltransferase family 2 protein [Candidatus Roizmanbacteria bacterium]|nr:MAG: glycosyltransferase family 2 protein [Candidatus Roizmanbacteria bacterium]
MGIPAFNEGRNIQNLLRSILIQTERSYRIDKIVLISDGSNDDTVWKARQVKNKRLQIIDIKKTNW